MKKTTKRVMSLVLCLGMTISMTGCGGKSVSSEPALSTEKVSSSDEKKAVTYKETITFANQAIPTIFDPHGNNVIYDMMSVYITHDFLLTSDADGNLTGDLATDYSYDKEAKIWTFKLREDAIFSDGTPVTAEDVAYSLMRARNSSYMAVRIALLESVDVVDDHTIAVHVSGESLDFLGGLTYIGIISKKATEEDPEKGFMIGSGPYVVKEYDPDNYVLYERVENYYDGEPKTKYLKSMCIKEAASRAMALQSGDIDIDLSLSKSEAMLLQDSKELTVVEQPSASSLMLILNERAPKCPQLADQRVRQAIAYCVNQNEIIVGGQEGYGYESGLFPKVCIDITSYGKNYPETNIEKAKELLAEAGYPDGFVLEINYIEKFTNIVEVLQAQLAKAGIQLKTNTTDITQKNSEQDARTYTSGIFSFTLGCCPGSLATKVLKSDGASHYTESSNAEVDAKCDEFYTEMDLEKRKQLGAELEKLVAEESDHIPLGGTIELYGMKSDMQGLWVQNNYVMVRDLCIEE